MRPQVPGIHPAARGRLGGLALLALAGLASIATSKAEVANTSSVAPVVILGGAGPASSSWRVTLTPADGGQLQSIDELILDLNASLVGAYSCETALCPTISMRVVVDGRDTPLIDSTFVAQGSAGVTFHRSIEF